MRSMRKPHPWNSIFHSFYADALRRGGRGRGHLTFVMGAERECMQRADPLRALKDMLSSPRKSFKMPNNKEDRFATAFLESSCRQQERKFISLLDQGMTLLFCSSAGPKEVLRECVLPHLGTDRYATRIKGEASAGLWLHWIKETRPWPPKTVYSALLFKPLSCTLPCKISRKAFLHPCLHKP